jgi:hypothetical protein
MSASTSSALNKASGPVSPIRSRKTDLLNKIEDGLYLGSLAAAAEVEVLAKHKINAVLTLDNVPISTRVIKSLKHYKFVSGALTFYFMVDNSSRSTHQLVLFNELLFIQL